MAGYTIQEIETAIIDRLINRMGAYVKTIVSYQGNLPGDLTSRGWRLPLSLVRLASTRAIKTAAHVYDLEMIFTILVADRNWRGNEEARRGEGGVYQMLEDVRIALWDQDLNLNIDPLGLVREEAVMNDREFSVFEADYRTRVIWTAI